MLTTRLIHLSLACFVLIAAALVPAQTNGSKAKVRDTPPKPIYTPDPEYTQSARHDRVQGTAAVELSLDTNGVPHDMKVVKSLRSDLDEKAIEAVGRWRFTPAMRNGKPIAASLNVEVAFRLY